jgi:anthranilate synthase component 2
MKILVIDNYDSFTYNLVQYIGELGAEVVTVRNDQFEVKEILSSSGIFKPDRILISPGPGRPRNAGISLSLVKEISKMKEPIPIFGVCLGHQVIGEAFGATVGPAKCIMHGKVSKVTHSGIGLFRKIPSPYTVTRYHSLALLEDKLPQCLEILARTDDQEIMAIRHRDLPFYGVQFHPEAILTDYGYDILQNFMEQT